MSQRWIIHVDMDAFFVSVEQAINPDLRGKPVVVGGNPQQRGVVASASYEARKYGLHAAMPLSRAYRLCPHAIFLPGRFEHYLRYSRRLHAIFRQITPLVEAISLDEAFLDLTGFESLYGPTKETAQRLKERIKRDLDLTASIGIATNKLVAKVASERGKPDGLVEVPPGEEKAFLSPLPVGRLPGVGPVTERVLRHLGIATIGQLADAHPNALRVHFGTSGSLLHHWANGNDSSLVQPDRETKSIGRETTFSEDTADYTFVKDVLLYLCERVASTLRKEGWMARNVHLKLRFVDFHTLTRQATLPIHTDAEQIIYPTALEILEKALSRKAIRLIGVSVSQLKPKNLHLSLFGPIDPPFDRLNRCIDDIRSRYGFTAVQRGPCLRLTRFYRKERDRYDLHTPSLSR